jgi:hypothetical protein
VVRARLRLLVLSATVLGFGGAGAGCNLLSGEAALRESDCVVDCEVSTSADAALDAIPGVDADGTVDARPALDGKADVVDSTALDGADHADVAPPILFIQTNSANVGISMSGAATFDGDVQKGDVIIVGFDYDQASGATLSNVTDSQGNAYGVAIGPFDGAGIREYIAFAPVQASGSDTVTVTLDATTTSFFEVRLHEYAGLSVVKTFDVAASGTGTSDAVDGMTTPPITTTSSNELVFAMGICGTCTPAGGFTLRSNFDSDFTADEMAPTAGAYAGVGTETVGSGWAFSIAAFRGL